MNRARPPTIVPNYIWQTVYSALGPAPASREVDPTRRLQRAITTATKYQQKQSSHKRAERSASTTGRVLKGTHIITHQKQFSSLADWSGDSSKKEKAAPETNYTQTEATAQRLSLEEQQQLQAHALLVQWVSKEARRVSSFVFQQMRPLVSEALLGHTFAVTPSSSRQAAVTAVWSRTVTERAAKSYLELLVYHRAEVDSVAEWRRLCEALCVEMVPTATAAIGSSERVARLPLLSTGRGARPQLLSALTTWQEGLALLRWAERYDTRHISSRDVEEVLVRYVQAVGSRDGATTTTSATNAYLSRLWQAARRAEQADPLLAAGGGVRQTEHQSIGLSGKRMITWAEAEAGEEGEEEENREDEKRSSSAQVWSEWLLQGRWREVQQATVDILSERATEDMVSKKIHVGGDKKKFASFAVDHRAAMLPEEEKALLTPLTEGLNVLHVREGASHTPDLTRRLAAERRGGRSPSAPPSAVVELRRRVRWLAQLPPHVPRSLVRFEGSGKHLVPYLPRSLAREALPWFLVSALCEATDLWARGETEAKWAEALTRGRERAAPLLFTFSPSYAAMNEYVCLMLTELGAAASAAVQQQRDAVEVLQRAVQVFLQPPPPPSKGEEEAKLHAHRNYYVSLFLETMARVGTLDELLRCWREESEANGAPLLAPESAAAVVTALATHLVGLLGVAGASARADKEGEEETLLAACLEAFTNIIAASTFVTKRGKSRIQFVVAQDKKMPLLSYFKGIYDSSFFTEVVADVSTPLTTTTWHESAAALLAGRSLRLSSAYPTTTTEVFFRVSGHAPERVPSVTYVVPLLRLALYEVDLAAVLRHFGQRYIAERRGTDPTAVVATDAQLPYGLHVVYKPAFTNCTLNALYPTLLFTLARHLPWRDAPSSQQQQQQQRGVPVVHQHGLVNRIDVGTSGLVLATRDRLSLQRAIAATTAARRVTKYYRALVQHCPALRPDGHELWYLPPRGELHAAVFAEGSDAVSVREALHDGRGGSRARTVAQLDRRPARTQFRVLEHFPRAGVYYVEVQLESGRRHQVRQHFALLGHPLLGDTRYHPWCPAEKGERQGVPRSLRQWAVSLERPALHAFGLTIRGKTSAEETAHVQCAVPADMKAVLDALRRET